MIAAIALFVFAVGAALLLAAPVAPRNATARVSAIGAGLAGFGAGALAHGVLS